jgi:multiple sugar transport system ATP-binding protein
MALLELRNICKQYKKNGAYAVQNLNATFHNREFIVLVGPSGCGKSTVLKMIAGLEEITSGDLLIDETRMNDIEPHRRGIAMVFQSYALYPHLTVYENIAFPLRLVKIKKAEIDRRVKETVGILKLDELLERFPKALSGGQQQRVALGRAMVRNPRVFLLDEPLSNLDAKLRQDMRVEIAKLHQRLETNFIYVTHDQVEAMTLGQRIVVLKEGLMQQFATPLELYRHPANRFVAGFIGSPPMNLVESEIINEAGEYLIISPAFRIKLPLPYKRHLEAYGNRKIIAGFRPSDLSVNETSGSEETGVLALFVIKEILGDETIYYLTMRDAAGHEQSFIVKSGDRIYDFQKDQPVYCTVNPRHIYLFDSDTGRSLLEIKGRW